MAWGFLGRKRNIVGPGGGEAGPPIAPGCDKTHFGVTLQEWNDPLNPDLESHLIYRQLLAARDSLTEKHLEYKEKSNATAPVSADEGVDKLDILNQLFQIIQDLEKAHQNFERWETSKVRNLSLDLLT